MNNTEYNKGHERLLSVKFKNVDNVDHNPATGETTLNWDLFPSNSGFPLLGDLLDEVEDCISSAFGDCPSDHLIPAVQALIEKEYKWLVIKSQLTSNQ
jgi:hypothetical protein